MLYQTWMTLLFFDNVSTLWSPSLRGYSPLLTLRARGQLCLRSSVVLLFLLTLVLDLRPALARIFMAFTLRPAMARMRWRALRLGPLACMAGPATCLGRVRHTPRALESAG